MPFSILVVDDQPSNRELMSRVLGVDGYRQVTAASGEEGHWSSPASSGRA